MSQPFIFDWVRETSTTTGTGTFTLDGAAAVNFRTFASVLASLDTCIYTIRSRTALEAESGIGQFTAGGQLARQTILESTNANAAVNFGAGTKDVYIAPISKMFPTLTTNEIWQGVAGSVPIATASPTFVNLTTTGVHLVAAGTLAAPGLAFSGDANTGLFRSATDTIQLVAGGAAIITVSPGFIDNGGNVVTTSAVGIVNVTIKGIVGQTANMLDIRDSTNAQRFSVEKDGAITSICSAGLWSEFLIKGSGANQLLNVGRGSTWTDATSCAFIQLPGASNLAISRVGAACPTMPRLLLDAQTTQMWGQSGTICPPPLAALYACEVIQVTSTKPILALRMYSAGHTANVLDVLDSANTVLASITAGGISLVGAGAVGTPPISFLSDPDTGLFNSAANTIQLVTNATAKLEITSAGSVILAKPGALATNATDGFVYIPTCAGTPTGVPSTQTGNVPMVYDTTNNKLYVYNGAWKAITLA